MLPWQRLFSFSSGKINNSLFELYEEHQRREMADLGNNRHSVNWEAASFKIRESTFRKDLSLLQMQ